MLSPSWKLSVRDKSFLRQPSARLERTKTSWARECTLSQCGKPLEIIVKAAASFRHLPYTSVFDHIACERAIVARVSPAAANDVSVDCLTHLNRPYFHRARAPTQRKWGANEKM